MADGRTLARHARIYQNGYDLSGEVESIGALDWDYGFEEKAGLDWAVKGGLCDMATIQTGTVNTMLRFDTTAAQSPHDWIKGMDGAPVGVMIPLGVRAAPALGDPVWCALQKQKASKVIPAGTGLVVGTIDYLPAQEDAANTALLFDVPWGKLLHPKGAETASSTATGVDGGAATTKGGWMLVQAFAVAGAGSATFKVQHAAANLNANFVDVAGLSLAIANTAIPGWGLAQTALGVTINQFTRFQVTLTGITSVTFALAFLRGR